VHRFAISSLVEWKTKPSRKPLVLRGARQVGKSYLVRELAREHFSGIAEVNFERDPDIASLFDSKDPRRIVQLLELRLNARIHPGETLLFLDEIQAAPSVIAALRYFHEQMPELHVAAAGSLLEFALEQFAHSVPVGRLEYLYLGPMQFEEFLLAAGEEKLPGFLARQAPGEPIPEAIHTKCLDLFRLYLTIGGMPGAVRDYFGKESLLEAEAAKQSILTTYQEDFSKYGRRVKHQRLRLLFQKIPQLVGGKFRYANVDREQRSADLSRALELLCMAHVAYRVKHTAANGVPLGAEVKESIYKVLFLDVGLMTTALGLRFLDYEQARDVTLVNAGAVCEQAVGQHLLFSQALFHPPELHYWVREQRNSAAEVDFVISEGSAILPVEVKAGKTGTLKSLHLFMREKKRSLAIRLNSAPPSLLDTTTSLPDGVNAPYRLLSLPLYMIGQVRRQASLLLEE